MSPIGRSIYSILEKLSLSPIRLPLTWWGGRPAHHGTLTFVLEWDLLPRCAVGDRLDNFGRDDHLLLDEQHASVVICDATVVRGRGDRDELVGTEFVDGVEWVLVAAHDHADLVLLEEFVDDVRAVGHYIILLLWITHHVRLHALNLIGSRRVTPHDVHAHLLHSVRDSPQRDSQRSLYLINVLQLHD